MSMPAGSLTYEEQSCFDWFMRKTTTKFAGVFPSRFWEVLVFQVSAQEPAVRHAVIALSAAHRFDISRGSWIPARYGVDGERFTLQQYNKAIHHLRDTTSGYGSSKNALRVALITCMLFVTLEYLRGQYQMGSAHLRYGIKLLADISAPQPRTSMVPGILSPAEDFVHDALIDSYARLTIQSAMFGHVPSNLCVVARDPQVHALPYTFSSHVEARQTLDDLLNRIHCLNRFIDQQECPPYDIHTDDPEAFEARSKILADLSLWKKAYNSSLSLLNPESRREKVGLMLLRVYYEMARIMASTCLSSEREMIFDTHTNDFIAVMTTFFDMWRYWSTFSIPMKEARHAMEYSCSSISEGYSFTIESGFIPPMYYTALKCRILKIRLLAIRLLRAAPHREGVWNGPLLADVLEEVLRLEEGSSFDADKYLKQAMEEEFHEADFELEKNDLPEPNIPAESRIYDVKVLLPETVKGITYMTYRKKGDGDQWSTFRREVKRAERSTQSWPGF